LASLQTSVVVDVVIAMDTSELDLSRFSVIDEVVKSTDALYKIRDLIEQKFTSSLKLRKDAVKELLIVTDDDSAMPASEFASYLQSKVTVLGKF
jgi:hypothetical protein